MDSFDVVWLYVVLLNGFARIRSVCESVRIANQFAGEAWHGIARRFAQYQEALRILSDSHESVQFGNPCELRIDNPGPRGVSLQSSLPIAKPVETSLSLIELYRPSYSFHEPDHPRGPVTHPLQVVWWSGNLEADHNKAGERM